MVSIAQVLLAVGWALLIGNLVFQALKSMAVGLGFEGEDPKLLFTRTFVFAFLLMASPQICEVGLSLTARIIELLEIPDAINVTLVDEGVFGSLGAAWLLVIIFGLMKRCEYCAVVYCIIQSKSGKGAPNAFAC